MMYPTPVLWILPLLALLALPAHAEDPAPAPAAEPTADETTAEGAADDTADDTADAVVLEEKKKAALEKAYAAEQKLAAELRAEIKDNEALSLQVQGQVKDQTEPQEVLALFKPQTKGKAEGAVLLLHGKNAHPDWPGVIGPLRRELPREGWHSLSLQLAHRIPEQSAVEWLDASRLRIADALAELDGRSIKNIVIIGHGQGAVAAIDYLTENLAPEVEGVIVISLDGRSNDERRLDTARGLGLLKLPILDIYGERDRNAVVSSAKRRYDLARRNNDDGVEPRPAYGDIARDYSENKGLEMSYRQIKLSGADPQFSGQTNNLIKRLRGWLKRYAT